MSAQRIPVQLPGRQYSIHLGRGLLTQAELYPEAARAGRALVVTNDTVGPLLLPAVRQALGDDIRVHSLPDGERYKSLAELEKILDTLLAAGLGRDAIVIALGGGVVGDLAGFAAAIYQRGIALLQIPTTLLAQVDSSVGGKTAVNHPRGKNMIGAFHQPEAVLADLDTLATLPERELRAGIAEIIKYGLLGDADFFAWLEANMPALLARDDAALMEAIATSCRHKARVVAADERESGQRALLNLGHTFGHAIEAHLAFEGWLHGEAVAAGMCLAADMSQRHGWLDAEQVQRVRALVEAAGLPTAPPPGLPAGRMRELMQGDKKTAAGRLRLVLLRDIGEAALMADYDDDRLADTLAGACRP